MRSRVRCSRDRKSTRLNSSHHSISYAVFCLKKKKTQHPLLTTLEGGVAVCCELVRRACDSARHVARTWTKRSRRMHNHYALFFFFLNDRGPPEFSPFPLPAPLPI